MIKMSRSKIYLGTILIIFSELFLARYSAIVLLIVGLIIGLLSDKIPEGAYNAGISGFCGILFCDILFIINFKFLGLWLEPLLGGFTGFTLSGNESYIGVFYYLIIQSVFIAILGAIGSGIKKVIK